MGKKAVRYAAVDAFTAEPFKGKPAAACLLEEEGADERWVQSVAAEFNLSETAFLVRDSSSRAAGTAPRYHLRWFTPATEVDLCGHATFLYLGTLSDFLHYGRTSRNEAYVLLPS